MTDKETGSTGNEVGATPGTSKDTEAAAKEAEEDLQQKAQLASAAVALVDNLNESARIAFCSYAASILRLDFPEDWNKDFRLATFNVLLLHFQVESHKDQLLLCLNPDGAATAVTGGTGTLSNRTDDVVMYIEMLKKDEYLQQNGLLSLAVDLIAVFIGTGCYDARHRILLRHICALLAISWDEIEECELSAVHLLEHPEYVENEAEKTTRSKRERNKKIKRYLMIGAGSAIGGVLIGLTGGLAAPIFAGGVAMIAGSAAAAGIATTAGAAIIGSIFGVAGAGLAGYKMNRRVGDIEEFAIETLTEGHCLHIAFAVSGWISEERDDSFRWAWRHLAVSGEQYCLRYESKYLLQLGQAFEYLMSFAVSYAIQQTLMETALAGLVSALAWPLSILTVGNVVDNPWSVCVRRSTEVGEHLAHIFLSRQHGHRPVTLLGFSLGARVIFHCLLEMAKDKNAVGIVEDVVLLGAPVAGSPKEWKQISTIVAGRIINGYCSTDWMLKFLYRTMNAQFSIAGTAPVETGCRKVVNVNLSHIVQGQNDYQHKLTEVLKAVGVKVKQVSPSQSFSDFRSMKKATASTTRTPSFTDDQNGQWQPHHQTSSISQSGQVSDHRDEEASNKVTTVSSDNRGSTETVSKHADTTKDKKM